MESKKDLKVAVTGFGAMGRLHTANCEQIEREDLREICEKAVKGEQDFE